MRVLHIIDPGSAGGGACTLRLLAEPLARLQSVRQDVLVLGTRRHVELAVTCGVDPIGQIGAPANLPLVGRRSLMRFLTIHEANDEPYDIVHAWSPRAAILAMLLPEGRSRLATLGVGPVIGVATDVFMWLIRRRPMSILAGSTAVRREYVSLGVDPALISVHPPAVNPDSVEMLPRAELRRRWEVDDDAFVVGLLSEPASWADARIAAEVIGRVAVTGRKVRLVVHDDALRRIESQRWMRTLGAAYLMATDGDLSEPWRIVQGLDAALLIGGELNSMDLSGAGSSLAILTGGGRRLRPLPGILPLLWSMSAGVPVIAEASDAVSDVISDGVDGLLVAQHDTNAACHRLVRLYDDRTIAGRLGSAALERVRARFHVSTYCVRLKDVYARLASGRAARVASEYEQVVEMVPGVPSTRGAGVTRGSPSRSPR